jgi:hypothetical protein
MTYHGAGRLPELAVSDSAEIQSRSPHHETIVVLEAALDV